MSEIIKAIVFGVIQGISEWLPISSTGHLILVEQFLSLGSKEFFEVFKVVIQLGSILAVCVLYFRRLNPFTKKKTYSQKRDIWQLWFKIFIGVIPAGIIGVLFDDMIESQLSGIVVIAITLIVYGVAFIFWESKKHYPDIQRLEDLDYKSALGIGCFQVLALIPGTSRSGATILGGSILGCSRKVASEFSFFLALPVMAGASLIKLLKFGFTFTTTQLIVLCVGTLVSFVVSIFAIRFLLDYIREHDFKVFGYYRIILGIIIILTIIF
ncbi:MAG: undecaprenyl-diphosphate phosphatase [Breznakia sp.]